MIDFEDRLAELIDEYRSSGIPREDMIEILRDVIRELEDDQDYR